MDGIEVVLIAVDLFAVGEALCTNVMYEGRVDETQNRLTSTHTDHERVEALLARLDLLPRSSAFRLAPCLQAADRRS